jgi:hypothetical protein
MIEEMETTVMKEMGQTVRMEAVETTEKTETKGGARVLKKLVKGMIAELTNR